MDGCQGFLATLTTEKTPPGLPNGYRPMSTASSVHNPIYELFTCDSTVIDNMTFLEGATIGWTGIHVATDHRDVERLPGTAFYAPEIFTDNETVGDAFDAAGFAVIVAGRMQSDATAPGTSAEVLAADGIMYALHIGPPNPAATGSTVETTLKLLHERAGETAYAITSLEVSTRNIPRAGYTDVEGGYLSALATEGTILAAPAMRSGTLEFELATLPEPVAGPGEGSA